MTRLATAILCIGATVQLAGCMAPLSLEFGLYTTKDYISPETLKKLTDERLTTAQVKSLLGEPAAVTPDGKAMGYMQCATWSVKCMPVVIGVPVPMTGQCPYDECRQVGIWFDDTGRAIDAKSFNYDYRLRDQSLELWLLNDGRSGNYIGRVGNFRLEDELFAPVEASLALVAPGNSYAGVFSIEQGDKVLFGRMRDGYVDWHRLLRIEPGTYTISYYAAYESSSSPRAQRSDAVELEAGHKYAVGSDYCRSWTRDRGCAYTFWGRSGTATYVWFADVTTGQVLRGSKTEPQITNP
jgi:hypothetical protein